MCKILSLIDDIKSYYSIKQFYNNEIYISDSQLISIKWEKVVECLQNYVSDTNIDIYTVSNKIMAKDNYMILLVDNDIINLNFMTHLMEWNIKYCIIHHIFDDKNKLKPTIFSDRKEFIHGINKKLKIVSIFNFTANNFLYFF